MINLEIWGRITTMLSWRQARSNDEIIPVNAIPVKLTRVTSHISDMHSKIGPILRKLTTRNIVTPCYLHRVISLQNKGWTKGGLGSSKLPCGCKFLGLAGVAEIPSYIGHRSWRHLGMQGIFRYMKGAVKRKKHWLAKKHHAQMLINVVSQQSTIKHRISHTLLLLHRLDV